MSINVKRRKEIPRDQKRLVKMRFTNAAFDLRVLLVEGHVSEIYVVVQATSKHQLLS